MAQLVILLKVNRIGDAPQRMKKSPVWGGPYNNLDPNLQDAICRKKNSLTQVSCTQSPYNTGDSQARSRSKSCRNASIRAIALSLSHFGLSQNVLFVFLTCHCARRVHRLSLIHKKPPDSPRKCTCSEIKIYLECTWPFTRRPRGRITDRQTDKPVETDSFLLDPEAEPVSTDRARQLKRSCFFTGTLSIIIIERESPSVETELSIGEHRLITHRPDSLRRTCSYRIRAHRPLKSP